MEKLHLKQYYAHGASKLDPDGPWQLLSVHLRNVAEQARFFAETAKPNDHVFKDTPISPACCMIWVSTGGSSEYLRGERSKGKDTRHAVYGAKAASEIYRSIHALFSILGHHSGLTDCANIRQKLQLNDSAQIPQLLQTMQQDIPDVTLPVMPPVKLETTAQKLSFEFAIRMIFSCLVDADWMDTAAHMQGISVKSRTIDAETLLSILNIHVSHLNASSTPNELSKIRAEIYKTACERAELPTGFFSMTVPTGGGKTLSSMAFALHHAAIHRLHRVIVVIPYLSIIEQNADVYRSIFGEDVLIEHHSAVDTPDDMDEKETMMEHRLVTENWNAPLVVTTSVQFIETLFSSSPGRCRKLHNIARSVVIFDECQTLPSHLLDPTLNIFRELVDTYGTSILFCSATQPGFSSKASGRITGR